MAHAGPTRVQRPAATDDGDAPGFRRRDRRRARRVHADGRRAPGVAARRAAVVGREIAVIAGLGFAALTLALLTLVLVYVGTFLFLGEWLFGSMGWGILHGTLLAGALITAVVLNLPEAGWVRTVEGSPSGS